MMLSLCIFLVIFLSISFWLVRYKQRKVTTVEESLQRLRPVPSEDILEACIGSSPAFELNNALVTWKAMGGLRGYFAIFHNAGALLYAMRAAREDFSDFFDNQDVQYLRDRALAIRKEAPAIVIEALLAKLTSSTPLHALFAARMYSEIKGCIGAIAEQSGEWSVTSLSARL